jgi:hypothetical protein
VPDLLAGINWIQVAYPSPCTDATVQLVGGTAMQGTQRAVLDDVVPLDPAAGLAVAFLSCRDAFGTATETSAVLLRARPPAIEAIVERQLGPRVRVVAADPPAFTLESPAPPRSVCCPEVTNLRTLTASPSGLTATPREPVAAFDTAATPAATIGLGPDLVRRSVPAAALCYPWDNVWLSFSGVPSEPRPASEPSAELQTIRLALIRLTGRWIAPTDWMNAEMADAVSAYQESRGLVVDGAIGDQTTSALRVDLGCPDVDGFSMVLPGELGRRHFSTVADLIAATDRFARSGTSGNTSLDRLLRDSRWDGANAMFLGCDRWDSPANGLSCSWSGATPLQLVGLVVDPNNPGLTDFSILYARSAAA